MALGAYEGEVGRGNVLNALAHPTVVNPVAAIGGAVQTARGIADLRTTQFNLQQAQLQPVNDSMRMLLATNPNPTDSDVQQALGFAARNGGSIDGTVANYADWRANGGNPADFVRARALGGMTPENQALMGIGTHFSRDTGAGVVSGITGGVLSGAPGVDQPRSFIQSTLSPAQATDMVQVGVNSDGSAKMVPRWQVSGSGAPGIGPAGAGSAAGNAPAAAPAGPPPGSSVAPGTPLSQKDADLALFAQRESGNQNVLSRVPVPPGYTQNQAGSGYYQIIPSTWAEGQQLAGIPQNQRTQMAMQASPQQQYQVASALYDKYGGRPWAQSAPQGQGGTAVAGGPPAATTAQPGAPQPSGPFIGATSAQPVIGPGANVRPAGGMQYFSPTGQPVTGPGGVGGPPAGGYGGYSGLPLGAGDIAHGNITRQQALEAQMNAAVGTRATLEGMEAELYKLPSTGVATGALSTIKNALVQSGALSQQELDRQSQNLAATEQFDKFSAMLNGQLLAGMGGQATDARQELTGAATPSSVHSVLGNMGIIHMLEGNLIATQVMGREFQSEVQAGRASPQQFDQWRNNFTKPGPDGARFDPRVFWLASMQPQEQQTYVKSLNDKDKAQLLKNSNYAEQKGWVFENKDGSMGTGY